MTELTEEQPFSFAPQAPSDEPRDEVSATAQCDIAPLDLDTAMAAAGVAAYRWEIAGDRIAWSANAADILGCEPALAASGKAFAARLDHDNFTSRYDVVMHSKRVDAGDGVPYAIEYLFHPGSHSGSDGHWVEDHGRWFAGPDGLPRLAIGTVRRITDRHNRDQQLSFLGSCDPLTGMMNRGRMAEALGQAISVAEREGGSCGLILAAINNLGVVNDAFGFEIADEVIVSMGRRLRQAVRAGDAIARYSGSKFGIILNACDEEALEGAILRFVDMARESVIETRRGPVWALLSVGGIILPNQAGDAMTAMARAEEALSEARRKPSDGHLIYRPSVERDRQRQLNATHASEIVRCLREDRFLLAFQPVVARDGDPAAGYHEALLRIRNAAGEIITAGELIPIAEQLGLVRLIDRAVVQMAIATLNRYPDARLAINISGTTAIDPRWSPQITALIEANRHITGRLMIEITETVALTDLESTRRFAAHLRALGCSVAVDDFGAGFTSFRSLKVLPVDVLKIDGHFCSGLSENPEHQYFVRALIDLARTFGFKTVAEWVEDEASAELLKEWKVDYMQGNLFGAASLDPPWTRIADELPIDLATGAQPDPAPVADAPAEEFANAEVETPPETGLAASEVTKLVAPVPPSAAPDETQSVSPIAEFEQNLSQELSKLRSAIAALDSSFQRSKAATPPDEPSYADLVSDTVLAKAG